jgi:hypothetical protein
VDGGGLVNCRSPTAQGALQVGEHGLQLRTPVLSRVAALVGEVEHDADEVADIVPSRTSNVAADTNSSRRNGKSPVAAAVPISAEICGSKAVISGK